MSLEKGPLAWPFFIALHCLWYAVEMYSVFGGLPKELVWLVY